MTTRHPSVSPTRIRFGSHPAIAPGFVKRQGQDELFEAVFARSEPRTVLTGMRGSGKTQLAAAVAARCEEEGWPLVAWIHAASRKEILAGLYEFALRIGIDAPKNIPLEVIVQRLLDQLRSAEAADRLFVFDNVENPDDLRDLIPEGAGVRVLITTPRHFDWDGPGWLRLTVGAFEREQSITLLCERTGDTHREAADRIAEVLGDVPLAITQAAATAKQGGYALSGYLDRLSHHPLDSRVSRLEGDDYPDAVGTALLMAYEQVLEQLRSMHPQRERIAVSLLDALSLLAASGLPTHWLLRLDSDSDAVGDTLSFLKSASVIHESSDGDKTFIHWLQGHVYRETYLSNQKKLDEASARTAALLSGMDVDRLENPEQRRHETHHLIEQLLSVTSQDYSHSLFSEPRVSSKLAETLHYATSLGMSQLALCLTDSVTRACDALGPHHPDTLTSRNSLAGSYRDAGRLDKAIALYEQILEDSIRVLGLDHPRTLTSRFDLAGAYRASGRLEEAITLYEQVFSGRSRVLGPDHRSTLMSRDELADAYLEAGRFDEAITLKKQILADAMRIMGADSPGASAARLSLASIYRDAGRLDEAVDVYKQILDDVTRIMGLDHPDTLTARNRLAVAYRDAGRLEEAIPLFEQNLTDFTRLAGPDHPHTLSSRSTLPAPTGMRADSTKPSTCTSRSSTTSPAPWASTTLKPWLHATASPAPTGMLADWTRPSPCTSGTSPTSSASWVPTAPTPSPHVARSRAPTRQPAGSTRPSPCSSRSLRTAPVPWDLLTLSLSPRAATSPMPTGMRAGSTRPSACSGTTSRPASVSWAPTTPVPSLRATISPARIAPRAGSRTRTTYSRRRENSDSAPLTACTIAAWPIPSPSLSCLPASPGCSCAGPLWPSILRGAARHPCQAMPSTHGAT